MNRVFAGFLVFSLVIFIVLSCPTGRRVAGRALIRSTEEFVEALEAEYRDIKDFAGTLTLSGLEPPVEVLVKAITEPRTLRVEYLSPAEMKGQFFLLKQDFLYQYMPAREIVIKKDLTKSNTPVRAANLTPGYLLELVRSEDLAVNLIGGPEGFYCQEDGPNSLASGNVTHRLNGIGAIGNSPSEVMGAVSCFGSGQGLYVLEVIPRAEDYQFARQVIKFSPDDLLPVELITHFLDRDREPVRTIVKSARTNMGLKLEELAKLPEKAEVISG